MRLSLALAAIALTATALPIKAQPFVVQGDDGYMNLRTGPGVGHGIIGTVRNGIRVDATQCAPRDDAPGPPWCFVHLRNAEGWISTAGLVPVNGAVPAGPVTVPGPMPVPERLICEAPRLEGGGYDPDPVTRVDIVWHDGLWSVLHTTAHGHTYERAQQYTLTDQPIGNGAQWFGDRVKNGVNYHMVGSIRWAANFGRWAYGETLYANGALDMRSAALCSEPPAVVPVPLIVPAPTVVLPNGNRNIGIAEQPAAPVSQPSQQTAPTQQNGAVIGPTVVAPPSNNTTNFNITIVPGSGAEQYKIKPESSVKPDPKEGS